MLELLAMQVLEVKICIFCNRQLFPIVLLPQLHKSSQWTNRKGKLAYRHNEGGQSPIAL